MSVLTTMELLTEAQRILRSRTRTPGYWSASDRLTQMWTGKPLRANPVFVIAAGADLNATDWLYDEGVVASESAAGVLVGLTRRFQEMVMLETATQEVRRLRETGLEGADIAEALCAIIALLTTEGTAALDRRGSPELTARWQRAWADFMWRQNLQQQRICGLGLLPRLPPEARRRCMETLGLAPEDLVPRATSFSGGVEEFLHTYGETSSGSVAMLGSLPFSTLPLDEVEGLLELLCAGPSGLLPVMARLLRFAPDVAFDPAEALNTGVFATAAEQRRSLLDVMGAGGLSKPDLDARLLTEWERYASRLSDELDTHLSAWGGAGSATAATIVQELFQLLELLVPGTWKQG
jgi:hypothetical protein